MSEELPRTPSISVWNRRTPSKFHHCLVRRTPSISVWSRRTPSKFHQGREQKNSFQVPSGSGAEELLPSGSGAEELLPSSIRVGSRSVWGTPSKFHQGREQKNSFHQCLGRRTPSIRVGSRRTPSKFHQCLGRRTPSISVWAEELLPSSIRVGSRRTPSKFHQGREQKNSFQVPSGSGAEELLPSSISVWAEELLPSVSGQKNSLHQCLEHRVGIRRNLIL